MKVDIISKTKQKFNGYNFWKDRQGYYKNAQIKPHSLHRYVWEFHYGKVPKGLVIDHIDRNKDNNQIENLRAVTPSVNNKNVSVETTRMRREQANKIRSLAAKWHQSKEGREWHKKHGVEAYQKRKPVKLNCAFCGKEFSTTKYSNARFCSNNCKMRARTRRLKGLPENSPSAKIKKMCVICGKEFYSYHSKAYTCSDKCRNKRMVLKRKSVI